MAKTGSVKFTTTMTSPSDKNMISSTVGLLKRQIRSIDLSGKQEDLDFDITGKNPLLKFKDEIVQINLLKQMKIILDPAAQSAALYHAGCSFIKLLFGENYKPSETEVTQIVHFICSNPTIPLEQLIKVSSAVSEH